MFTFVNPSFLFVNMGLSRCSVEVRISMTNDRPKFLFIEPAANSCNMSHNWRLIARTIWAKLNFISKHIFPLKCCKISHKLNKAAQVGQLLTNKQTLLKVFDNVTHTKPMNALRGMGTPAREATVSKLVFVAHRDLL